MTLSQENKTNLIFYRAFLFFFISTYVLRIIFSSVYFKQLGLSSSQTGLLQGVSSIARAFGAIALGCLADCIDRRKTVFLIALFSSTLTPFLLTIPWPNKEKCLQKSPRSQLLFLFTPRKNGMLWDVQSFRLSSFKNKNDSSSFQQNAPHYSSSKHETSLPFGRTTYQSKQPIQIKQNNRTSRHFIYYIPPGSLRKTKTAHLLPKPVLRRKESDTHTSNHVRRDTNIEEMQSSKIQGMHTRLKWSNNSQFLSRTEMLRNLDGQYDMRHSSDQTRYRLHQDSSMDYVFVILLLITIVGDFLAGPALNLCDTAIMANLGHNKDLYGRIRLWGDFGQMILVPSVAVLEHFSTITVCGLKTSDFTISLWITSTGMAIALFIGFKVNMPSSKQNSESNNADSVIEEETPIVVILRDFITPLSNWSLLANAFFLGVFLSAIQTFLFWTMIDLDASQASLSVGVSNFCRNITSMVAYYYSTILLQRFGIRNVINISIGTYLVSFVIAAFFRNPWLAVIPDCLVYMALAFSMTACVLHVSQVTPVSWSGTAQGRNVAEASCN